MTDTTIDAPRRETFEQHALRGRFNAAFFHVMEPALRRSLGARKERVFAGLPHAVVELGSGAGANLRYLPAGATLVAVEPNIHMQTRLRMEALRYGIHLVLLDRSAADTGLAEQSADAVISSLVLCSVPDPAAVLAEVRRILRPGGTFRFVEHVVAGPGTARRRGIPGTRPSPFSVHGSVFAAARQRGRSDPCSSVSASCPPTPPRSAASRRSARRSSHT